ncbi:MAG: regulatory protein RecX [Clostridia bacterium]|nr:regulatory protein RecX [Clostridia bacterium]
MRITTTVTKKGRINIFADGEYAFTVPVLIWYASGFSEGETLTEEALWALRLEGQAADAYETAVRMLSLRAHGERELINKLRQKYPAQAAAAAVEKCKENLLLDDEAFSCALASELAEKKHFSPERIEKELLFRGIDRETAKNAVLSLDIDRKTGIIRIIRKMHLPPAPEQKELNRAIRRLLTAGYSMGEIRQVLRVPEEYAEQE